MTSRKTKSAAGAALVAAVVTLYAYQKAWINDESRFKISNKSRQIGITWAATLRVARKRVLEPGKTIWLSASERQSREAIEFIKLHLDAMKKKIDWSYDEEEVEGLPDFDYKVQLITIYKNGKVFSKIYAMPANPDTVRGFAGDIVLDEFGFHRDADAIWRASMGIASRGHQVEVISTPNGARGRYYELARKAGLAEPTEEQKKIGHFKSSIWSAHWCDIHKAVAEGCPIDADEMREAIDDEESWFQEYLGIFLQDAMNYIPMELVVSCESSHASIVPPEDWVPQGPIYVGVDVGRKKDLTCIWEVEDVGGFRITRRVQTLKNTPFSAQRDILNPIIQRATRAAFDATGIGAMLAEEMRERWGSKVEEVVFTAKVKDGLAPMTKAAFEEKTILIPSSPVIRRALNAVKRFVTPAGNVRFDADRTDAGHADEFWALALALEAATLQPLSVGLQAGQTAESRHAESFAGAGSSASLGGSF